MALPWQNLAVRMDYEWHWRNYEYAQTLFTDNDGLLSARSDTSRILFLQLSKPSSYSLTVALQYQGIWNDFNIPVYHYTKNVLHSPGHVDLLIRSWCNREEQDDVLEGGLPDQVHRFAVMLC